MAITYILKKNYIDSISKHIKQHRKRKSDERERVQKLKESVTFIFRIDFWVKILHKCIYYMKLAERWKKSSA